MLNLGELPGDSKTEVPPADVNFVDEQLKLAVQQLRGQLKATAL